MCQAWGEDAHPTFAPAVLPQLSLCRCFLWHELGYVSGWNEVLSPRDLAFLSPWLACSATASLACLLHHCVPDFPAPSLHSWLVSSTSVSPSFLLHHCIPGSLAPSLHPWLACSITVFPARLLHHVIPSLLAPSLHLLFFLERQR